jgi:hypothetical protein
MSSNHFVANGISALDALAYIAANNVQGFESPEGFRRLSSRSISVRQIEERQVREFLRFLSQLSFLHFKKGRLWYAGPELGSHEWDMIWSAIEPRVEKLPVDPSEAVLALGRTVGSEGFSISVSDSDPTEVQFIEGSRSQRTHILLERNGKLRQQFLSQAKRPLYCDVCELAPDDRYVWTNDLVEIHHLLPLSAAIKVGRNATKLDDIVPVCPTCHRAVHRFYTLWLQSYGQKDFRSAAEAHEVYETAKIFFA